MSRCSRRDSNAELGIRNHQRSQCFQGFTEKVVLLLSFLRLSLPITHIPLPGQGISSPLTLASFINSTKYSGSEKPNAVKEKHCWYKKSPSLPLFYNVHVTKPCQQYKTLQLSFSNRTIGKPIHTRPFSPPTPKPSGMKNRWQWTLQVWNGCSSPFRSSLCIIVSQPSVGER